jgi:hypothetical protein
MPRWIRGCAMDLSLFFSIRARKIRNGRFDTAARNAQHSK